MVYAACVLFSVHLSSSGWGTYGKLVTSTYVYVFAYSLGESVTPLLGVSSLSVAALYGATPDSFVGSPGV